MVENTVDYGTREKVRITTYCTKYTRSRQLSRTLQWAWGWGVGVKKCVIMREYRPLFAYSEGSRTDREDTVRVYRRHRPLNREDTVTVRGDTDHR